MKLDDILATRLERFSTRTTEWAGSTTAFILSLIVVFVWLATGPIFHFSDTWQLIINTVTNVVTFVMVDEQVLRIPPMLLVEKRTGGPLSRLDAALQGNEQRMIEQALEEAEGRVSGPAGAAARLGVPASTLESKIRRFSIDKLRYRVVRS